MSDTGNKEFVEKLKTVCATYADKTAITYMRDDGIGGNDEKQKLSVV